MYSMNAKKVIALQWKIGPPSVIIAINVLSIG